MTLPLSSQCCSLESAKRLRKLGVKASCLFGWVHEEDIKTWTIVYGAYSLPAYTTGELGELLPELIDKGWLELEAKSQLPDGDEEVWGVCYVDSDFERKANGHMGLSDKKMVTPMFYHANEAEARALCLIHLLENNLCPPK